MSILSGLMQKLMAWVLPRPRFILGATFASVVACIFATITLLDVQTNQLELISQRHPLIALSDKLDEFNFHGKATFAVVVRSNNNPNRAIEFVNALVEKIRQDPQHFQDVFYRIDPEQFKKWVLYYLDEDELVQIRERIEQNSSLVQKMAEDPELLTFFRLVNQEMTSRMVGEFFTGFLEDDDPKGSGGSSEPMDLDFLIKVLNGLSKFLSGTPQYQSPWSAFFKSGAWDLEKEGYIWEGNKQFLIAAVMPAKIKDGVSKTQTSLIQLRQVIKDLQASNFSDVEAGVTGQEALNNDEMQTAMDDMSRATWLSLLGLIILLLLFLRGIRHPVIIMISLGVGLCWTFGWTSIFIGHLNILSIVFAPLLCGLGVDYGIHWFARYEEEMSTSPGSRLDAIRRVMEKSGPGIFIAGLSTACTFMPFLLTGFRGLMELGMITGMGILFTLLADFTVLPSLARYFAAGSGSSKAPREVANNRYMLHLGRLGVPATIAGAILLCTLSAISTSHVKFDLNPLRLQSENAEAVIWEKVLVENAEHSVLSVAALSDSPQQVLDMSAKLRTLPTVLDVDNVFTILPEQQEAKVPVLRSILAAVPDLNRSVPRLIAEGPTYASLKNTLDPGAHSQYAAEMVDVLQRIRFKMQADQADKWGASRPLVDQMNQVRQSIAQLLDLLQTTPEAPVSLSEYRVRFRGDIIDKWTLLKESSSAPPMQVSDLPPPLRDQFLQDGQYLMRIYPKDSIWEEGALKQFISQVQSVVPEVIGDPVSLYVFSEAYKKASIAASIYALIAIVILHTIAFRSVRLMLLSLVPLIAGASWTVGLMGITGVDFNLANSIFAPLVVGAGVEYGVIVLARWQEGKMPFGSLPFSTGKGVILASLTTTVGFGTLMISHHRGIFSLGFVAWAGSICVLLSALFVLPSILSYAKAPKSIKEQ
ncbi:MAG: MMPL family transporter [Desulfobacteraceae bacterium]|nr:MMPL family transporter [Desulfobacteraceae bacterium]